MPNISTIHAAADPKRFQCRHIHHDGRRCGSPALKKEIFCFYHHTTRKPVPPAEVAERRAARATFDLPLPEDRSAIQASIGQILRRIANRTLDPRRAGLLLYGLQIAALTLPRPNPKEDPEEVVDEIVQDPIHGDIAPETEMDQNPPAGHFRHSFARALLEQIGDEEDVDDTHRKAQGIEKKSEGNEQAGNIESDPPRQASDPIGATLPRLQAGAEDPSEPTLIPQVSVIFAPIRQGSRKASSRRSAEPHTSAVHSLQPKESRPLPKLLLDP